MSTLRTESRSDSEEASDEAEAGAKVEADAETDLVETATELRVKLEDRKSKKKAKPRSKLEYISDEEFEKVLASVVNNFTESRAISALERMHKKYMHSLHRLRQPEEETDLGAEHPEVQRVTAFVNAHKPKREELEKKLQDVRVECTDAKSEILFLKDALTQKSVALNRLIEEETTVESYKERIVRLKSDIQQHRKAADELKVALEDQRQQFGEETSEVLNALESRMKDKHAIKRTEHQRNKDIVDNLHEEKDAAWREIHAKGLALYSQCRHRDKEDAALQACNQTTDNIEAELIHNVKEYAQVAQQTDKLEKTIITMNQNGRNFHKVNHRLKDELLNKRMANLAKKRQNIGISLRNGCLLRDIEHITKKLSHLSSILKAGRFELAVAKRGLANAKDDITRTHHLVNLKTSEKNACLKKMTEMKHLIKHEMKETRDMDTQINALRRELQLNVAQGQDLTVLNQSLENSNSMAANRINELMRAGQQLTRDQKVCEADKESYGKSVETLTKSLAKQYLNNYALHCQRSTIMGHIWDIGVAVTEEQNRSKLKNSELRSIAHTISDLMFQGKREEEEERALQKQNVKKLQIISDIHNTMRHKEVKKAELERHYNEVSKEQQDLRCRNTVKSREIALLTYQRNLICTALIQRKAEIGLVARRTTAVIESQSAALTDRVNLVNDVVVMKTGIRQLRWKVRQSERCARNMDGLWNSLQDTCTDMVFHSARLSKMDLKAVPETRLWKNQFETDPSRYEIHLKIQVLTKRLILKTEESCYLQEGLLHQGTVMKKLQLAMYKVLSNCQLQKSLLFKRHNVNRKEKKLKALMAEFNMNETREIISLSTMADKKEEIKNIRTKVNKLLKL